MAAAARGKRPWDRLSELEEYELLLQSRLEHAVHVDQPLVLISQVQRSGGTLLSQLFDGHPECHAHPGEVRLGHPNKLSWPALDLSLPYVEWFRALYKVRVIKDVKRGYRKSRAEDPDVFPFLFSGRLQRQLFGGCIEAQAVERDRQVLDCWFTSFFNAWLDNHNLYTGPKRVVTGFTPVLALDPANVAGFFASYPDGTLVTIVRRPESWYASAARHRKAHRDVGAALALWRASAEAGLAARERYGDRVVVLTYEQLVGDTEATMARLAARLGIAMRDELLQPTYNGRPIRANSSFAVDRHGVLPERRGEVDTATAAQVQTLAGDLYERAEAAAG